MFYIKGSRIISADIHMYLFIVPWRQSQRHSWDFPEHSILFYVLGCRYRLFLSLLFSVWININFQQNLVHLPVSFPCPEKGWSRQERTEVLTYAASGWECQCCVTLSKLLKLSEALFLLSGLERMINILLSHGCYSYSAVYLYKL